MVRGKFQVTKVASMNWSPTAKEITFQAIYDTTTEENKRFSKATPSGSITMTVDNPSASNELALGSTFYVDFSAVPCKTEGCEFAEGHTSQHPCGKNLSGGLLGAEAPQ